MTSSLRDRGDSRPHPGVPRAAAAFIIALILLTLAAYSPIRHNGFVLFDDDDYITRNAVIQRGLTVQGVALAFTRSYAGNWFPLTWLSHMLDVELFGLDPRGHHLTSLVIHLVTALILLLTIRAMTGRAGPSFLVAALFAVHPLHVESVAWASERKDVLAAFFWVLTTALYVRHARRPSAGRLLPVLLTFALGLMAKQMLVTLPLVLLLLDFWPLGRLRVPAAPGGRPRRFALLLEKVPLLALATLAGLLALNAQGSVGLVHSFATFPLEARVANAILTPVRYLAKTVWPAGLAIFYPFTVHRVADPQVLSAGGLIAAASVATLFLRRRHPWLLMGWFWYLVTLLPVIGLIQVGDQAMADRYTYIPLVGIFIALSWSLSACRCRGGAPGAALAAGITLVLLALAGLTQRQVSLWRDDATLFGHTRRVTRDNWVAEYLIGLARDNSGDRVAAASSLRESIRIKPDFESSRLALARLLRKDGRDEAALAELHAAVGAIPGSLKLRTVLALALVDAGRDGEAVVQYREAIRRWPQFTDSYADLAALLVRRGETAEAVLLLRRALAIDPAAGDVRMSLEALTGGQPE